MRYSWKKEKNFPRPSELLSKHTPALSAFMFIQLLASGKSQQNSSVCKFNLWAITSNRRLFCRHDSGVCQSACPYGLIGILSKHKGMMGELWSKCPCPIIFRIPASNHWFMTILMLPRLCMQTNHLLDYVHAHFVFITCLFLSLCINILLDLFSCLTVAASVVENLRFIEQVGLRDNRTAA